jgi:hypothetical protein
MKMIPPAAFAFALLAAAPVRADTACLQIGRIWSFHPLHRNTLIVEDELHRKFRVDLMGYCPRLPFKLNLGFKSASGINGLDCVRKGDDVISQDVGMNYTCPVTSVVPYTPDMEKADKAKAAAQGRSY